MTKNKKTKGLGRGIEALFQDSFSPVDEVASHQGAPVAKDEVVRLPLAEIRSNPYQPRKHFNEDQLADLAASIKSQGVIQPVIVRQSSVKGYELIAGERRLRASQLAGLGDIPAIIRPYNDEEMMTLSIIENLQRADLSPLEEAAGYDALMKRLSLTQEEVAQAVGKSRSYIANLVRLLSLPQAIKDMVQAGGLSMGHARTLLTVKPPEKMIELAQLVQQKHYSVRQLEDLVASLQAAKPKQKKQGIKRQRNPFIVESEDLLMDKFGTNVSISQRGESGKIEIEYLSERDLTRILDLLQIRLED